jgi:hypothetical protein
VSAASCRTCRAASAVRVGQTRIWCAAAVAAMLGASHSPGAAAALARNIIAPVHSRQISNGLPSQTRQFNYDSPLVGASLTFVVSVCLADFEYLIACRERGLLEAAKRLEQIYLDDYAMKRAAGSLKVWFPPGVERSEQLRFLREVEDHAIASMAHKLQDDVDQIPSQINSKGGNDQPAAWNGQKAQEVRRWREDADMESREGVNWSHDWSSRTHSYRTGTALHELVNMNINDR